ncbi:hypothetical protein ACFPES_02540 [Paenibacillus sp. GCM10023248]|uniref:hypothetical protein n=1 Tax=unclassified Paenibacillus TaxID=185978 RepID=UPI0023793CC2|nr:hypothetical protein [Paenibacillus sp. MAHUQ-63]MDD9265903.1 hypothetical protein [Paenibacillus sp. MAHUQ-63]
MKKGLPQNVTDTGAVICFIRAVFSPGIGKYGRWCPLESKRGAHRRNNGTCVR